jgi:hypothetical protein
MNCRDAAFIQIEVVGCSGVSREVLLYLEANAPSRKPLSALREIVIALRRYRRFLHYLVRAIWLETRTAVPRTRLLISMMSGKACLPFGKVWEIRPNQPPALNIRTSERMRDTQLLMETFPWASAVDILFSLEGWNMGEESRKRIDSNSQQCVVPST